MAGNFPEIFFAGFLRSAGPALAASSPRTLHRLLHGRNINAVGEPGGFSVLHRALFWRPRVQSISYFITRGADPHLLGREHVNVGEDWETPLSLAMRSRFSFSSWRKALEEANVPLKEYITRACQEQPLSEGGWTEASLLTLFQHSSITTTTIMGPFNDDGVCGACERSFIFNTFCPIESSWQRTLDSIKAGQAPGDGSLHCSIGAESSRADTSIQDDEGEWEDVDEEHPEEQVPRRWQDDFDWLCWWCWTDSPHDWLGRPRRRRCAPLPGEGSDELQDTLKEHEDEEEDSLFLPRLVF